MPLDEPKSSCAYGQSYLDPLGVGAGKVSNRAEATSQQAVKLSQSLIAEIWGTSERVRYLRCTEG